MIKRILSLLSVGCLLFAIGCSSTPKDDEAGLDGEGADITEQPLSFDPMGSDSGTIAGLNTVYFDYDSSNLGERAKQMLSENIAWINSHPNVTIQVEGHTDSRGSNEYNLTLGERRANAVVTYMQGQGVDGSRLSVISYGEEKLQAVGDSDSDHAKNRRANFVPR